MIQHQTLGTCLSPSHTHPSACTINPLPPEESSEGVMWRRVESGGDEHPSPTSPLHHHMTHKMRQIEPLRSLTLSNYVAEVKVRVWGVESEFSGVWVRFRVVLHLVCRST